MSGAERLRASSSGERAAAGAAARLEPAGPPGPPRELPSGRDPCPPGPLGRLLALASEDASLTALRQAGESPVEPEGAGKAEPPEVVLSRGALLGEVAHAAAILRASGVQEGDRVALLLPNGREFVFNLLALWSLRATAVILSPFYTAPELGRCLRDAQPAGIVSTTPLLAPLLASGEDLPRLRFDIRADGPPKGGAGPGEPELREPPPDLLATVHFTYKGIGYPLGAMHTYEHYARGVQAMTSFYRPSAAHTFLCALPLSHIYSLVGCVLMPLYAGGATAIVKNAKPQHVLRYAKTHGANVLCLVPALYRLLAMCARRSGGADLAKMHWISGGSYLPPELYDELERDLGVRPFQGYGLTEALIVTASNWESNRPGTLGVPLFRDAEIEILSEDGDPLPRGEVGEVALRAPTVMTGYLNRPEETARFLRDGRMLTGDVGMVDGDGFLHFAGRRRRFAKVAGFMVDLKEVEHAIRSHPQIESCAASTEPDELADELIRAAVTLRPGAEVGLADLIEHCKKRLAFYKVPKGFRFLKSAGKAGAGGGSTATAPATLASARP